MPTHKMTELHLENLTSVSLSSTYYMRNKGINVLSYKIYAK